MDGDSTQRKTDAVPFCHPRPRYVVLVVATCQALRGVWGTFAACESLQFADHSAKASFVAAVSAFVAGIFGLWVAISAAPGSSSYGFLEFLVQCIECSSPDDDMSERRPEVVKLGAAVYVPTYFVVGVLGFVVGLIGLSEGRTWLGVFAALSLLELAAFESVREFNYILHLGGHGDSRVKWNEHDPPPRYGAIEDSKPWGHDGVPYATIPA
mmetsp:Transcript_55373/g.147840  ORF Transcript_55373/g.147840 Transcript_55373/m.147840 type:complete len:211 (-) Transcript_55373:36-668(-)